MKIEKLHKIRWILVISSFLFWELLITVGNIDAFPEALEIITFFISLIVSILAFIFLLYKRITLQAKLRKFLIILLSVTAVFYLLTEHIFLLNEVLIFDLYWSIYISIIFIFILASIYCFTSYLHRVENILLCLVFGILIGLVLNRFGIDEAGVMVVFFLALSSFGFIFLAITSIKGEDDKQYKRSVVPFYFVLAVCNATLALKFSSYQPALTSTLDLVGVIVFLVSCIALFITMPFSNFIEWSKSQKQNFQKLILIPFVFFLLVFSLKFLLPDPTYRKIFFQEYTKKQKVYFGMDDYEIDIEKKINK
ncbi:hypothetical protein ES705_18724 [subsurface metagenome]